MFTTLSSNESGFTLVELMVAVAVSTIVLAAIIHLFISTNRIHTVQKKVVHMQQGIRASLDIMSRDLRMAGLDPTGSAANATIAVANATDIQVLYDYNGNGTCGRDRHYRYDPAEERLEVQQGGGGGFQGLVPDIDSMSLSYTLADGSITSNPANPDDVRVVTVSICGQISGAYADTFNSTYCFNNTIACRNMGL